MSKVIIDRDIMAVRVEGEKVIDACWLGTKFALRHHGLANRGWNIICYEPSNFPRSWYAEGHTLETGVHLPFETTTFWADAIAEWIKNPPQPRYCPQCGRAT